MTIHADLTAITPTANARQVFKNSGTDIDVLFNLAHEHASELQKLLKQIIALHPTGGGDATNLTALNNLLAEFA